MNPLRTQQQSALNETPTIEILHRPNTLSLVEKGDLERCETVIRAKIAAFLDVGRALLEIKERKLYREKHSSFEAYCHGIWGFKRSQAHRMLEAAEVCSKMSPAGDILPPEHERHARPLRGLSPEKTIEAWRRATELAGTGKITGDIVKKAVSEVCPTRTIQLEAKLDWQRRIEPLLKQALASTKRGERDQVEKMIQHVSLLLAVGQLPNPSA